ncbi:hypothetical protein TNCT_485691 [Trichonephila clavata]|uniref:Uncharacterized protein n=1 Tax=Trichonephila clavata TaxID=2740835 RepID=A0A8X6JTL7_TRICU|nr:hypothetical protein TNCT_485691 [Trichonephila clavata]
MGQKHYKQTISSRRRRAKKKRKNRKKIHLFEDFFSGIYISIHPIPPPYPPQRRINLPELGKAAKQGNSAVRDDGLFVPEEFMTNAKARGNAFVWASVMFQEEPRKGMMQLAHPPQPRHSDLYTNNERRMNAPRIMSLFPRCGQIWPIWASFSSIALKESPDRVGSCQQAFRAARKLTTLFHHRIALPGYTTSSLTHKKISMLLISPFVDISIQGCPFGNSNPPEETTLTSLAIYCLLWRHNLFSDDNHPQIRAFGARTSMNQPWQ